MYARRARWCRATRRRRWRLRCPPATLRMPAARSRAGTGGSGRTGAAELSAVYAGRRAGGYTRGPPSAFIRKDQRPGRWTAMRRRGCWRSCKATPTGGAAATASAPAGWVAPAQGAAVRSASTSASVAAPAAPVQLGDAGRRRHSGRGECAGPRSSRTRRSADASCIWRTACMAGLGASLRFRHVAQSLDLGGNATTGEPGLAEPGSRMLNAARAPVDHDAPSSSGR